MRCPIRILCAVALGFAGTGCTLIELEKLVPASVLSEAGGLAVGIKVCQPPNTAAARDLAHQHAFKLSNIHRQVDNIRTALPWELASDPLVHTSLEHVKYTSTASMVNARILLSGQRSPLDAQFLAAAPKPPTISPKDFLNFTFKVGDHALRQTASTWGGSGNPLAPFWINLRHYYSEYNHQAFVSYFGQQILKPRPMLTVDDTEIVQAAGIFLEMLFDEALMPTVWKADGLFYPGRSIVPPTYLSIHSDRVEKVDGRLYGCGMTPLKAEALNDLATRFAIAATAETSLTIKSIGGMEVGLGLLGKLNFGDNTTLTGLLQVVVAQAVKRLTFAIGAPILESIDLEESPTTELQAASLRAARVASTASMPKAKRAELIHRYSGLFVSTATR
jgi:hypothetical protein